VTAAVGFLDTNVLVRHFTGDPPEMAQRASRCLRESRALFVPDLVLAETAYVLARRYRAPRSKVAGALRAVLAFPSVRTVDRHVSYRAIEVYELHRLDFADAYLVAVAEASGAGSVVSFDNDIDKVGTVIRIEP